MQKIKRIASVLGASLLFTLPGCASERLNAALTGISPVASASEAPVVKPPKEQPLIVETPEPEPVERRWYGKNFTATETRVLNFLQERGITDRAALATILGNIRQESRFDTIVCEGGKRTGYRNCRRGGFGLIQWTTYGRYKGLGNFSYRYGMNPDSLDAQLRWMVNEVEWRKIEYVWKTPGKSINGYMWAAKKWLGWGIHGNRTYYAHTYYDRLYMA